MDILAIKEELLGWNEPLKTFDMIDIDRMPDLALYMDQVITFITQQLEEFAVEGDKTITPSMINNYTKNGVLPRPVNKKYNKEHLSSILMLSVFKQIIPINDAKALIHKDDTEAIFARYEDFAAIQKTQVRDRAESLEKALREIETDEDKEALLKLSVQMIVEANILSIYAKKILHTLNEEKKTKTKK